MRIGQDSGGGSGNNVPSAVRQDTDGAHRTGNLSGLLGSQSRKELIPWNQRAGGDGAGDRTRGGVSVAVETLGQCEPFE